MSTELFEIDAPDLDSFIKELDLLEDEVREAAIEGMKDGADVIFAEQKRLAESTGVPFLAEHISKGNVYVNKKGGLGISVGYQPEAFKTDENGKNPGVVGMTFEFGRPGESPQRSKETMRQFRNGKHVDVKKGRIAPVPHIRPGFDSQVEKAADKVIDSVTKKLDKTFTDKN